MTKPELVFYKSSRVRGRLARVREGLAPGREGFSDDTGRIEQVAFNMFLAMQESLDLASHIVSDDGWGTPATFAETIELLERNRVLSPETSRDIQRGVRLRNLIAHAYGDLDPEKLFDAATAGVVQIERYLFEVASWLAESQPGS